MRIAIVDDNPRDARTLEAAIAAHLELRGLAYQAELFASGAELFAACEPLAFDLVFLDVYLEGESGVQIAERLRSERYPGLIAFVTVSAEHAVDGFRVRAFHYLVKPFDPGQVADLLDEALARLAADEALLRVHDGQAVVDLPLSQLRSVVADGHYLALNTVGGPLRWRQTFGRLVELAAPYPQLFACNRGVMVNLEHVDGLAADGSFVLDDGSKLPVRRISRTEARNRYLDCLFPRAQA